MDVAHLRKIPGFTLQTMVASESMDDWKPAYQAIDLAAYFAPSRPVKREPLDPKLLEYVDNMDEPVSLQPQPTLRPIFQSSSTYVASPPARRPKKFKRFLVIIGLAVVAGTAYGGICYLKPDWGLPAPWALFGEPAQPVAPIVAQLPVEKQPESSQLLPAAPAVQVVVHKKAHTPAHHKRKSGPKKHSHHKVTA